MTLVDPVHGYPRPQLERPGWHSLDGIWDFALDPSERWSVPSQVIWDSRIRVPFSPETPASGIENTGFYRWCWYRRTFEPPALVPGDRLLLHFGAVDHSAKVWINGAPAGEHEGGYTPFTIDTTIFLTEQGPQEIVVRVEDDPADLAKPRGKQDWKLEPHSIWYPRTTGIWQTVWMERVPSTWIQSIRWTPNLERWEVGVKVWLGGQKRDCVLSENAMRLCTSPPITR